MSEPKHRRHKVTAKPGRQAELTLRRVEPMCRNSAVVTTAAGPATVLFEDPDPNGLWAGRTPLADFLCESGLGSVLAVRTFMRQRDWAQFEAAYKPGGRPPYHPAVVMSLVVFGVMEGQSSLRMLESLARADVRVWWLTGGVMPDHSAIGRFLNRHAEVITKDFFEDLTRAVVRLAGTQDKGLAVDATVIQAAASRLHTIKQEAARQALQEVEAKVAERPQDAKQQQALELAKKVVETCEQRSAERKECGRKNPDAPVSPVEPEAVVQPMKNGQVAPSYQACIGVNSDRIIVAQHVEGSSEPAAVPHLIEQAERVLGAGIDTLLGDTRYNTGSIHALAAERGFEVLSPEGTTSNDGLKKTKLFDKTRFEYDCETNTYRCPAGKTLHYVHKGRDRHGLAFSQFRARDCGECPLRAQCNKAKGNRTLNRYDHEGAKERLRQKMQRPEVRAKYRKRQTTVEPVFAETKAVQGYVRYRRKRIRGVRLEHSLHSCAHNLRRALRIKLPWTRHDGSGSASARRPADGRSRSPSRAPFWRRPVPGMLADRPSWLPGRCHHLPQAPAAALPRSLGRLGRAG